MEFDQPLLPGRLLRRYKRFLADVELDDGRLITAHTPNTGSMTGCSAPGARVWLSRSDNPRRKYPCTLELVEARPGVLVGVHTGRANQLVAEAIAAGRIVPLRDYPRLRREVSLGPGRSRIDLMLEDGGARRCYVEVKSVTWVENGTALFPDAVSARGRHHLEELATLARAGHRAVIFYCVQRGDARRMAPAAELDPAYAEALAAALASGVEALAYDSEPAPEGFALRGALPVSA